MLSNAYCPKDPPDRITVVGKVFMVKEAVLASVQVWANTVPEVGLMSFLQASLQCRASFVDPLICLLPRPRIETAISRRSLRVHWQSKSSVWYGLVCALRGKQVHPWAISDGVFELPALF